MTRNDELKMSKSKLIHGKSKEKKKRERRNRQELNISSDP